MRLRCRGRRKRRFFAGITAPRPSPCKHALPDKQRVSETLPKAGGTHKRVLAQLLVAGESGRCRTRYCGDSAAFFLVAEQSAFDGPRMKRHPKAILYHLCQLGRCDPGIAGARVAQNFQNPRREFVSLFGPALLRDQSGQPAHLESGLSLVERGAGEAERSGGLADGTAVFAHPAQLRNSSLKTARAWALKETAMRLYSYVCERPARKHFRW